jgi:IclR family transcriptional regulator, KDG regulon repressor
LTTHKRVAYCSLMAQLRSTLANHRRSGLDSGLDILEALALHRREMTLTDIAAAIGMSKSGVHSQLTTLLRRGFVTRATNAAFSLGIKTWEIGSAVPHIEIGRCAAPHMSHLADETGEGVILGRLDGAEIVYLHLVEGTQAVRVHANVGDRIPAHCTSTGLALLAALSDEEVKALLPARFRAVTAETITTREELLRELQRIRLRGYAINRGGWRLDVGGMAACVCDAEGAAIAALCVAVPRYRMTRAWLARISPRLMRTADQIAQAARPKHPPERAPVTLQGRA